ncbi:MAG: elongation factor 1-beta [Nitrososphaerota archaeon]
MRGLLMANVLLVVRVYPETPEVDLSGILENIRAGLPHGVRLKDHKVEEMGFGLQSLLLGLTMPDSEGVSESVERSLQSVPGVSEVNVERVTRIL